MNFTYTNKKSGTSLAKRVPQKGINDRNEVKNNVLF
jgi:hypothetical protein